MYIVVLFDHIPIQFCYQRTLIDTFVHETNIIVASTGRVFVLSAFAILLIADSVGPGRLCQHNALGKKH